MFTVHWLAPISPSAPMMALVMQVDVSTLPATTLAGGTTLASLAGTLTLAGDITGNYALTVQGDGDVVLAGARDLLFAERRFAAAGRAEGTTLARIPTD